MTNLINYSNYLPCMTVIVWGGRSNVGWMVISTCLSVLVLFATALTVNVLSPDPYIWFTVHHELSGGIVIHHPLVPADIFTLSVPPAASIVLPPSNETLNGDGLGTLGSSQLSHAAKAMHTMAI